MASLSSYGGKLSNFGNTGGSGPTVTTIYLDTRDETLAAGFTTSLSHKYRANRASLDAMWDQYRSAKDLGGSTVTFMTVTNTYVSPTLAQAYAELKELETNFYQATIYDSYTNI
jgi:hypothetical protein